MGDFFYFFSGGDARGCPWRVGEDYRLGGLKRGVRVFKLCECVGISIFWMFAVD